MIRGLAERLNYHVERLNDRRANSERESYTVEFDRARMASGAMWSKEEILTLIEVWGDDTIQAQLQDCTRNQKIFERVARELNEAGYDRTFQQCRDKIRS